MTAQRQIKIDIDQLLELAHKLLVEVIVYYYISTRPVIPMSGSIAWVLGLLVGINLLTSGWAIVMVALEARELVEPLAARTAKH